MVLWQITLIFGIVLLVPEVSWFSEYNISMKHNRMFLGIEKKKLICFMNKHMNSALTNNIRLL